MQNLTKLFVGIISEGMDPKQMARYADWFSENLNKFDSIVSTFEDDYTYDESMEPIVEQIKLVRDAHAKLVKMLNSKKYGRP